MSETPVNASTPEAQQPQPEAQTQPETTQASAPADLSALISSKNRAAFAQLSSENQKVALRIATRMKMIRYINSLPPEKRESVIDAIKKSDPEAVGNAIAEDVKEATGSVSDAVKSTLGIKIDWSSIVPKPLLNAFNGVAVPFSALGAVGDLGSGTLQDLKAWASSESVGSGGFLGLFKSSLTEAQAEALGVAYATELQKQQNSHPKKNFIEGLFSKEWGTYFVAGCKYVWGYIGYFWDHTFGDKTSVAPSFEGVLSNSRYDVGDQEAASKALIGKNIDGVTVTEKLSEFMGKGGTVTTKDNKETEFKDPTQEDEADKEDKPEEPNNNKEQSNLRFIIQSMSNPLGAVAAIGTTVFLGKKAAPHIQKLANGAVGLSEGLTKALTNFGHGVVASVPNMLKTATKIIALPFPTTSGALKAATEALDKDATKAAEAAVKGNNYSIFERLNGTKAADFATAKEAYLKAHTTKAGAEMMEAERGIFTRIGDRLHGVANWFDRGTQAVEDLSRKTSEGISAFAQKFKTGSSALDPLVEVAAKAAAEEKAARDALKNAGIKPKTPGYEAALAKAREAAAEQATKKAAEAAAEQTAHAAASAGEAAKKVKPVSKWFKLGKFGGFATGLFFASGTAAIGKAMGASDKAAQDTFFNTAPLTSEIAAYREGRTVEAVLRGVGEFPILDLLVNEVARPATHLLGANVDPGILQSIFNSMTRVSDGNDQKSPSRPSVPVQTSQNNAHASQAQG